MSSWLNFIDIVNSAIKETELGWESEDSNLTTNLMCCHRNNLHKMKELRVDDFQGIFRSYILINYSLFEVSTT